MAVFEGCIVEESVEEAGATLRGEVTAERSVKRTGKS